MKFRIIASTDNRHLGTEFIDNFPVLLDDSFFSPDGPPMHLEDEMWRFFNSNYSIDTIEA